MQDSRLYLLYKPNYSFFCVKLPKPSQLTIIGLSRQHCFNAAVCVDDTRTESRCCSWCRSCVCAF